MPDYLREVAKAKVGLAMIDLGALVVALIPLASPPCADLRTAVPAASDSLDEL